MNGGEDASGGSSLWIHRAKLPSKLTAPSRQLRTCCLFVNSSGICSRMEVQYRPMYVYSPPVLPSSDLLNIDTFIPSTRRLPAHLFPYTLPVKYTKRKIRGSAKLLTFSRLPSAIWSPPSSTDLPLLHSLSTPPWRDIGERGDAAQGRGGNMRDHTCRCLSAYICDNKVWRANTVRPRTRQYLWGIFWCFFVVQVTDGGSTSWKDYEWKSSSWYTKTIYFPMYLLLQKDFILLRLSYKNISSFMSEFEPEVMSIVVN
jgi:hypothetical protein